MRIPIGRVPDPSRISASGRSHTSSRIPLSRYFLLHGATLTYFESEDGAKKPKPKPKGQLAVVSVGHAKNSDLPEMDQSEASRLYAAVTSDDPICKAVMLDRARKNLSLGRWHWALADLEMAVALGEDSADVWNDVGVCRLETGDDDAALDAYSKAASIAPDHPQAYANKSICLRRKGDLAEAEVAATKAIELAPKAAGNYAGRGTVREQKGDTEGAIADFKTALELDPHNATVLAAVMRLSSDLVGAASLSGYLDKRGQVNKDFKKRYDGGRVSDCGRRNPHSS